MNLKLSHRNKYLFYTSKVLNYLYKAYYENIKIKLAQRQSNSTNKAN